jgi:hypothetical protein
VGDGVGAVLDGASLLALAELTMAPYAPWSSDRSMVTRNGPRNRRRSRSRA